jgi:hypothetical protein
MQCFLNVTKHRSGARHSWAATAAATTVKRATTEHEAVESGATGHKAVESEQEVQAYDWECCGVDNGRQY